MDPLRRTTREQGVHRINKVFGTNYWSQDNSVKVSKTDYHTFEALEDNVNNTMKFRIEDPKRRVHHRRLLCNDRNGGHIVTLRKKLLSLHNTWKAFNEEESIRWFTAKKSRDGTHLDVFLDSNGKKFEVRGTYSEGTFEVQDVNELNFKIAEMREADKVIVNQNIDPAFIVALIVIQDDLFE